MKKHLFALICALSLSACLVASAQEMRHFEVSVSGGGPGYVLGWCGGYESHFSVSGEIKYTPVKWVSIGVLAGIHDSKPGDDYRVENPNADLKTSYDWNVMLMAYGNWLTREKFKLYSGIGYGTVAGYTDSDGNPSHGIQVTPIGVSFGKRLFGFAELGMGWSFCPARAGIGYRF